MRFKSDVPEAFQLLGEAGLTVEIPSMKDGYLGMNGKRVPFISAQQMLPCSNTEQKKDIIPPGLLDTTPYRWCMIGWKRDIPFMFLTPKPRNNES